MSQSNIRLRKAVGKLNRLNEKKYSEKQPTTVAGAVGATLISINGGLAPADLPAGSTGEIAVINSGRLASARYTTATGGSSVVRSAATSGASGGSGTLAAHGLSDSTYHIGLLSTSQAPQFALKTLTMTAGAGLTGGGTLNADFSFAVGAGALITVGADTVGVANGSAQYQIPVTGATPFTPAYTLLSSFAGAGLTFASDFAVGAGLGITVNANDVALASTVAGNGLTYTSGVLAVGAGLGITVNTNDVALTTPGTLTVATSNSSTGSHTHDITTSSAPGAAAAILASTAAGGLTLVTLTTTGAISGAANTNTSHVLGYATIGYTGYAGYAGFAATPFATAASYALLQDATDGDTFLNTATGRAIYHRVANANVMVMDSAGLKFSSAKNIGTDNYSSQITGWRVDYSGGGDFRYLFVDEMHAKTFIADLEQALAGGQIICKSVSVLYANFTAPAAGATANLTVRDLPSAAGMAVFQYGDIVRLRNFSRAGGSLNISDCWGVVSLDNSWTYEIVVDEAGGYTDSTIAGTFTMTKGANTTAGISPQASAATLQTALTGLASIGVGNCTVTKSGTTFTINFVGTLAGVAVVLTANGASLVGCTGSLNSSFNSTLKTQRYVFTRSTAPNAGAMTAATVVAADAIVLDYGVSGNGLYEVNAIDGNYAANSPYAQVATWTTHPATGLVVRGRFGKLSGLAIGVANEFGIAVGSGFGVNDAYVKYSNVGAITNNITSTWKVGGTTIISIDPASGIDMEMGTEANRRISFLSSGTEVGQIGMWLYSANPTLWVKATGAANTAVMLHAESTSGSGYSTFHIHAAPTTAGSYSEFATGRWNISLTDSSDGNIRIFRYNSTTDPYMVIAPNATYPYTQFGASNTSRLYVTSRFTDYGASDANAAEISNDVSLINALYLSGNRTAGFGRRVRIDDTVTIAGTVTGTNLNKLTTRGGAYATVGLANAVFGYASAVLFNAKHISDSVALSTSGGCAYLGAQYTGNITRPGMFVFDANAGSFSFQIGEAGRLENASITSWVSSLEIRVGGNIGMGAGSYGGGQKVMFLANATTVPTTNPVGGGVLYVQAGALKWRGSSGAITTIAVA